MTPKVWLIQERIRRAQYLLESSDLPLEQVSSNRGFGSAEALRASFRQIAQVTPPAYRRVFRGS